MIAAWALNFIGLFITTVGALLLFLSLYKSRQFSGVSLTTEEKRANAKYQRQLAFGVGLLAVWLVLQDLAAILL
jgi:hypothetical protein